MRSLIIYMVGILSDKLPTDYNSIAWKQRQKDQTLKAISVTPELFKWRRKSQKFRVHSGFEDSLGYRVSSRPAWGT